MSVRVRVKGRVRHRHEQGQMNKTEQRFATEHLAPGVIVLEGGVIRVHKWKFEPINLTLAPKTQYRPDFYIVGSEGELLFIEVKARTKSGRVLWEDDARVKFKLAADLYDEYRFICASFSSNGGWKFEEVGN